MAKRKIRMLVKIMQESRKQKGYKIVIGKIDLLGAR